MIELPESFLPGKAADITPLPFSSGCHPQDRSRRRQAGPRSRKRWESAGHVKESLHVPHRPSADLFTARAVYQNGMALVDPAGDVGVPASAVDRGGSSVWIDTGEVGRGQGGNSDPGRGWRQCRGGRRRSRFRSKRRSSPPKMRAQNLNEA